MSSFLKILRLEVLTVNNCFLHYYNFPFKCLLCRNLKVSCVIHRIHCIDVSCKKSPFQKYSSNKMTINLHLHSVFQYKEMCTNCSHFTQKKTEIQYFDNYSGIPEPRRSLVLMIRALDIFHRWSSLPYEKMFFWNESQGDILGEQVGFIEKTTRLFEHYCSHLQCSP